MQSTDEQLVALEREVADAERRLDDLEGSLRTSPERGRSSLVAVLVGVLVGSIGSLIVEGLLQAAGFP